MFSSQVQWLWSGRVIPCSSADSRNVLISSFSLFFGSSTALSFVSLLFFLDFDGKNHDFGHESCVCTPIVFLSQEKVDTQHGSVDTWHTPAKYLLAHVMSLENTIFPMVKYFKLRQSLQKGAV